MNIYVPVSVILIVCKVARVKIIMKYVFSHFKIGISWAFVRLPSCVYIHTKVLLSFLWYVCKYYVWDTECAGAMRVWELMLECECTHMHTHAPPCPLPPPPHPLHTQTKTYFKPPPPPPPLPPPPSHTSTPPSHTHTHLLQRLVCLFVVLRWVTWLQAPSGIVLSGRAGQPSAAARNQRLLPTGCAGRGLRSV